jgi:hypothetical protein
MVPLLELGSGQYLEPYFISHLPLAIFKELIQTV